jgi:tripartite-type tricarboxylate transporter receptor subunit TctC
MNFRRRGGLLALAGLTAGLARAEEPWPARPIRMIVPFAPGGASDLLGRLLADRLGGPLGQPVVVENRPGAGAKVGDDAVAR